LIVRSGCSGLNGCRLGSLGGRAPSGEGPGIGTFAGSLDALATGDRVKYDGIAKCRAMAPTLPLGHLVAIGASGGGATLQLGFSTQELARSGVVLEGGAEGAMN